VEGLTVMENPEWHSPASYTHPTVNFCKRTLSLNGDH
jgi:hypothetical protein